MTATTLNNKNNNRYDSKPQVLKGSILQDWIAHKKVLNKIRETFLDHIARSKTFPRALLKRLKRNAFLKLSTEQSPREKHKQVIQEMLQIATTLANVLLSYYQIEKFSGEKNSLFVHQTIFEFLMIEHIFGLEEFKTILSSMLPFLVCCAKKKFLSKSADILVVLGKHQKDQFSPLGVPSPPQQRLLGSLQTGRSSPTLTRFFSTSQKKFTLEIKKAQKVPSVKKGKSKNMLNKFNRFNTRQLEIEQFQTSIFRKNKLINKAQVCPFACFSGLIQLDFQLQNESCTTTPSLIFDFIDQNLDLILPKLLIVNQVYDKHVLKRKLPLLIQIFELIL